MTVDDYLYEGHYQSPGMYYDMNRLHSVRMKSTACDPFMSRTGFRMKRRASQPSTPTSPTGPSHSQSSKQSNEDCPLRVIVSD